MQDDDADILDVPSDLPPNGASRGRLRPDRRVILSVRVARKRREKAAGAADPKAKRSNPPERPRIPSDPVELAETAERLLVAFELLGAGVFDWDVSTGEVRFFRPGQPATGPVPAVKMTSADEWFESAHPDDLALASAAVDRALRGETGRFSTFYRRRNGDDWYYVRSEGKVVARGADGRALRVVGTYSDVTQPVTVEKGRQAREASARHAQARATLTEFASSLAHELNQPLAALSTNVQAALRLLEDGRKVTSEARDALLRSVALAERAADVVRAMRQLVRPEGRGDERFDLKSLSRDVCELLQPEARRADVVLRVTSSGLPTLVTADRGQVELILVNLVRNALEAIANAHSPRRFVSVRVRSLAGSVRLEVEDSGPGVDPAVRDRIFDAYFTTKVEGTGLGLRLCRSFAEAHGGRLVCAPDPPRKGALFILELPSGAGAVEPESGAAQKGRSARRRAPRG